MYQHIIAIELYILSCNSYRNKTNTKNNNLCSNNNAMTQVCRTTSFNCFYQTPNFAYSPFQYHIKYSQAPHNFFVQIQQNLHKGTKL